MAVLVTPHVRDGTLHGGDQDQGEVIQLSEPEKGEMKKGMPNKYNQLPSKDCLPEEEHLKARDQEEKPDVLHQIS